MRAESKSVWPEDFVPPALHALWEEVSEAKDLVRVLIETNPEDKDFHKIFGMYLGKILDLRKEMVKAATLNPDRLLLDALGTVVDFFLEQDQLDAAKFLGPNLKDIAVRIRETWTESKWEVQSTVASGKRTKKSKKPPRPRANPQKKKKPNADNED